MFTRLILILAPTAEHALTPVPTEPSHRHNLLNNNKEEGVSFRGPFFIAYRRKRSIQPRFTKQINKARNGVKCKATRLTAREFTEVNDRAVMPRTTQHFTPFLALFAVHGDKELLIVPRTFHTLLQKLHRLDTSHVGQEVAQYP